MTERIYLDNNATTPIDRRILDVVVEDLEFNFGNPSSMHSFGRESKKKIVKARDEIASYLNVRTDEIIFTSSGTESLNLAIRGFLNEEVNSEIISSSVEHAAVFSTLKSLEKKGHRPIYLNPGKWGAITANAVEEAITNKTKLIVLMAANNETGVKTDIEAIAKLAEEKNISLIVDGVAILGKDLFTIPKGVSAMCFSGHKIHAPKGIGFLYLKKKSMLKPFLTGGNQEYQMRAGTENVSGIVALSKAIQILKEELPSSLIQMKKLRDKFEEEILKIFPRAIINGEAPRIVNTSNISFPGIEGEVLLARLDKEGIAVSHGSACASGALEPSRILLNMGLSSDIVKSSLRFSLSRMTTEEEITRTIHILEKVSRGVK